MQFDQGVINILNEICKKFGLIIDWGSQNIIPYIQELIHRVAIYKICSYSVGLTVAIVVLVIGILIMLKSAHDFNDMFLLGLVFCIISTITIIFLSICLFKAIYLPELIFINYVNSF